MRKNYEPGSAQKESEPGVLAHLHITKVNMALYVFILAIAILILYFVLLEYLMYIGKMPCEPLTVNVTRNSVESFGGDFHPVIIVEVSTISDSTISLSLVSGTHEAYQSSGEPVTNYTSFIILPEDTFSTKFNLTVSATDEAGRVRTHVQELMTEDKPEVMFRIQ